ncbi:MAG: SGNH/GDSL hydrolase family protein [Pseudomonadota bacterium]
MPPRSLPLPARLAAALIVSASMLLAIEAGVRIARPDVFPLGTEAGLFDPARFEGTPGWRPGSHGTCFGVEVRIDARGCRVLPPPRGEVIERWLLLGDSVTFGVGVEADQTFAARLQAAREGLEVLDSGVVGYGSGNYGPALRGMLRAQPDIDQVLLFVTLNDAAWDQTAEGVIREGTTAQPFSVWFRDWLGVHVHTYQLAKGLLLDRSLQHYRSDAAAWVAGGEDFERAIQRFSEIAAALQVAGIPLRVFALPNEAQLREGGDGAVQDLLVEHLAERGVQAVSLVEPLRAAAGDDSRALYLFADSMHFTPRGHAAVAEAVLASLARQP